MTAIWGFSPLKQLKQKAFVLQMSYNTYPTPSPVLSTILYSVLAPRSQLTLLDPAQNAALGEFRTSPALSLCAESS